MANNVTNINSSIATADELKALRGIISKFLTEKVRPKIRELEDTPDVRGMINKVKHLVEVVDQEK